MLGKGVRLVLVIIVDGQAVATPPRQMFQQPDQLGPRVVTSEKVQQVKGKVRV